MSAHFKRIILMLALLVLLCALNSSRAQSNQTIYADTLGTGWSDGSWATVNFNNASPVHTGTKSISVTCLSTNYQALYFFHANFDTTPYSSFNFYIYSPSNGPQKLQVQATVNGNGLTSYQVPSLVANTWTLLSIPLSSLGASNNPSIDGFWIQSESGSPLPAFFVDDVTLIANTNTNSSPGTNSMATIAVDAGANRHAISPLIYGAAFATSNQLADLNFTFNRSGGDNESRYNWLTNAHNLDFDYYFESYPDDSATPGATADAFVADTKSGGAQPAITIPMIGWAPKLGPGRAILASYSVAKYGPQTSTDPDRPDNGNGIGTNSATHTTFPITTNNPNDANFQVGVAFEQSYMLHLMTNWGSSTNGGVKYYCMDNEETIWFQTHQDVHPVGTTMQEIYNDIVSYAGMVKSNDPNALVLAPEEWGWLGYLWSGYDQQWAGANNDYNTADFPDRSANGGMDYIPWLLTQLHQHDTNTGKRLLDYLTVHCYPQEGDVGSTNDVSAATQILRNQTTRQFWDSNYVDPSYIDAVIDLIPLMQSWVSNYYPGTKIGITEYNWGAESFINGATAQADILGIFGRQNLDLAARWETPAASTPTYLAMKIYRNYDGQKSTFGDTSVSATGPNPDNVAAFAATRSSDSALTVMVVSKYLSNSTPVVINVSNFLTSGPAQVWQLNASNTIARLSNVPVNAGSINTTVPGQSITLFIVPAKAIAFAAGPPRTDGKFQFSLTGEIGQTWILQTSTNLSTWSPVSTNSLSGTQTNFLVTASGARAFYRLQKGP